ncbi:MAG: DUF1854 domain-containing protein [Clostridia bacterium]|nr:DUF1854 domain-containing protein [Clostridia bacterium]
MAETQTSTALDAVISIQYLSDENAVFTEENGFITLKATLTNEDGSKEEKSFPRVYLHSAFPFDMPDSYISVLDKDQKEIGMIREISALSPDTQKILRDELRRKYYAPVIQKILSVKERYGFSYWRVILKDGSEFSFTVQDTYRSMLRITSKHIFVIDVDGNRFEIPDAEALDRTSYKKIELYL